MSRQRKWLIYLGGALNGKKNYDDFAPIILASPEYGWFELAKSNIDP